MPSASRQHVFFLPHTFFPCSLSFQFFVTCVLCFSQCFQCRGTAVGWICVFSFGLLTERLPVYSWAECGLRFQSERRGSSWKHLRGCVNRDLGDNATHEIHTVLIKPANQTTTREEEEAWLCKDTAFVWLTFLLQDGQRWSEDKYFCVHFPVGP